MTCILKGRPNGLFCFRVPRTPRRRRHAQFFAVLPQIVTHAKIAFRNLKPEARAEIVEKVVCNELQSFVRLVQLRKTSVAFAAPLAAHNGFLSTGTNTT